MAYFAVSMTDPPPTAKKASGWYGFAKEIASLILRSLDFAKLRTLHIIHTNYLLVQLYIRHKRYTLLLPSSSLPQPDA